MVSTYLLQPHRSLRDVCNANFPERERLGACLACGNRRLCFPAGRACKPTTRHGAHDPTLEQPRRPQADQAKKLGS